MEKKNEADAILEMCQFMDRLSNIDRYPMWDRIRKNNVSEHTFRVAILCMVIADAVLEKVNIDFEELIRKALLHDFGEALMGDITYMVKHSSKESESMFEDMENECVDKMFTGNGILEQYRFYAKNCKSGIEGRIVAIADMFDNILYGYREIRMGNNAMIVLIDRCVPIINRFTSGTQFEFVSHAAVKIQKECGVYVSGNAKRVMEERHALRP